MLVIFATALGIFRLVHQKWSEWGPLHWCILRPNSTELRPEWLLESWIEEIKNRQWIWEYLCFRYDCPESLGNLALGRKLLEISHPPLVQVLDGTDYLIRSSSREVTHFERPTVALDKFHLCVQVSSSAFTDLDEEKRWQKTYPLPQVFFVGRVNHGLKTVNVS